MKHIELIKILAEHDVSNSLLISKREFTETRDAILNIPGNVELNQKHIATVKYFNKTYVEEPQKYVADAKVLERAAYAWLTAIENLEPGIRYKFFAKVVVPMLDKAGYYSLRHIGENFNSFIDPADPTWIKNTLRLQLFRFLCAWARKFPMQMADLHHWFIVISRKLDIHLGVNKTDQILDELLEFVKTEGYPQPIINMFANLSAANFEIKRINALRSYYMSPEHKFNYEFAAIAGHTAAATESDILTHPDIKEVISGFLSPSVLAVEESDQKARAFTLDFNKPDVDLIAAAKACDIAAARWLYAIIYLPLSKQVTVFEKCVIPYHHYSAEFYFKLIEKAREAGTKVELNRFKDSLETSLTVFLLNDITNNLIEADRSRSRFGEIYEMLFAQYGAEVTKKIFADLAIDARKFGYPQEIVKHIDGYRISAGCKDKRVAYAGAQPKETPPITNTAFCRYRGRRVLQEEGQKPVRLAAIRPTLTNS